MAYMGMKTLEDKPRGLPQHKQGRETYLLRVARAVVDKVWNPPGWDDAMWAMAGIQGSGPEQFEPYCVCNKRECCNDMEYFKIMTL